jgi:hypothetical protein
MRARILPSVAKGGVGDSQARSGQHGGDWRVLVA